MENHSQQIYSDLFESLLEASEEEKLAFFSRTFDPSELHSIVAGFRNAILRHARIFSLPKDAIDLCGTGGDQKQTINVSTISAVLLASYGIPVCKHGNAAASSTIGSSDLLHLLGIPLPENENLALEFFEKHEIVFLHAPFFHPQLKRFRDARRIFGKPTVFNMVGPLCNPTSPRFHLLGAFPYATYNVYKKILGSEEKTAFRIVHAIDGYDEISGTGDFWKFDSVSQMESIQSLKEVIGEPLTAGELSYETNEPAQKVKIVESILRGEGTLPHMKLIALNAAFAADLYYSGSDKPRETKVLFNELLQHLRQGHPAKLLSRLRSYT